MRLTLPGLFLFSFFLFSSGLVADPIGTISLTGRYDGPNVAACSGTTTCQASSSITINPPGLGQSIQMPASIDATASFSGPTVYDPYNPNPNYGLDGKPIPIGSYLLNGSLNTFQGSSFGLYSQQQNPDVQMAAIFNIPVDSGDLYLHAFFQEGGDSNQIPSDNLVIVTEQGTYSLTNNYCNGSPGGYYCTGNPSADLTVLHAPGTSGIINFYANSSAWFTGTDSANFQVVLTGADSSMADAPEPGTLALLSLPLGVLAMWKRRKLS